MVFALETKEVTPEEFRGKAKVFSVEINGTPFVCMKPGVDTYIISWDGKIGFDNLEKEILSELPRNISAGVSAVNFSDPRSSVLARVSADYDGEYDFQLRKEAEDFAFRRFLKDQQDINYIRFDIEQPRQSAMRPLLLFSFATENSQGRENGLAVSLPDYMPVHVSLVKWISRHHSNPPQIDDSQDYQRVASALSRLRPPHV